MCVFPVLPQQPEGTEVPAGGHGDLDWQRVQGHAAAQGGPHLQGVVRQRYPRGGGAH